MAAALSTIAYYVLGIVLGIVANMLTPAVTARLRRSRRVPIPAGETQPVATQRVLAEAPASLVLAVGKSVMMLVGGATCVVLGAVFTVLAAIILTHHVPDVRVPGIKSFGTFLGGIAQGAGFAVVFIGSYYFSKAFTDMQRLGASLEER